MTARVVLAGLNGLLLSLLVLATGCAAARQPIAYGSPDDVPLCLAPARHASPEAGLLVGYQSGRLQRLSLAANQPSVAWQAKVDGGVLALLELSPPGSGRPDLIASTATGHVICFRGEATEPAWHFDSTCEVSSLAELPDVDGDGMAEVVAGGADHAVHLLSGKTGQEIWGWFFASQEGDTYVSRLSVSSDQDRDGTPEVVVWLWSGELAVVSGRSGNQIWRKKIGSGYTDALTTTQDLDGDGLGDLLVGGNDSTLRACSSRDGSILWSGRVGRPIRDVAVPQLLLSQDRGGRGEGREPEATRQSPDAAAYVCTAGGEVARFDLRPQSGVSVPRWTASLGDICRGVIVTTDVDRDGTPDVAACAENGVVAVFSGKTGRSLSSWRVGDTARAICPVHADDIEHLAVASLDGMVHVLPAVTGASAAATVRPPLRRNEPGHNDRRPCGEADLPAKPADGAAAPRVLILLYHDILPEMFNHYGTSVENFRAHMDMLVREKYTCVSLDQIADWIEGKGGMPDRAVCITFDGQYQGQYTYAYPILRERKLFATSYITTDWIGTVNHSDWHQIREMDAAGILDVQNHTINHPYLSRCERSEVVLQLEGCNEAIRRHLNGKISRHHTYPAGANNEQVRNIVRETGFRTATTIRPGPVTRTHDLMGLPRYMLCTHKTLEHFNAWLTGSDAPPAH